MDSDINTLNGTQKESLLIVDDDPLVIESSSFLLRDRYNIICASDRSEASHALQSLKDKPIIALIDLGLPPSPHTPEEGFKLIKDLLIFNSQMRILILSGQNKDANIQHALTLGAADFIAKPSDPEILKSRLTHQVKLYKTEVSKSQEEHACKEHSFKEYSRIVGNSDPIINLKKQIELYSQSPFPILISGASGSGKELIAKEIHEKSERKNKPYLAINCAAFTSELLDSQLFGHKKGAFTGADRDQKGFFEETSDGTLFLDEIGEMPLELQSKLLRVLENGEYYRIGETTLRKTSARIIAASNRNLKKMSEEKRFREDLFHRLSVLTLKSPDLDSRGNDKLELMKYFQSELVADIPPFVLDEDATKMWLDYTFPGNVRELRNIVIRLSAIFSGKIISTKDLVEELETDSLRTESTTIPQYVGTQNNREDDLSLDEKISNYEKSLIENAISNSQGNLSKTARMLKINRTTLYGKMQRLGISQD